MHTIMCFLFMDDDEKIPEPVISLDQVITLLRIVTHL